MLEHYSPSEKHVLTRLQRGIEAVSRPFQGFDLPEQEVIGLLRRAMEDGFVRRFGVVYDARRLGYKSVLCALDCDAEAIDEKAAIIASHGGVTHCYERRPLIGDAPYPALWFTFAMLREQFKEGLAGIRAHVEDGQSRVLELPALRRFKIDVVFDLQEARRDETFPGVVQTSEHEETEDFRTFSAWERALVRATDQQIPLCARPFADIARQLGKPEQHVVDRLQSWKREGVLRRIAAILDHRNSGFKANGMCVWPVEGDISAVGRRLAGRSEVTHCYQRPRLEEFPFDLYAMIHTSSREETKALFRNISAECGLSNGELFLSLREYKKASMQYYR